MPRGTIAKRSETPIPGVGPTPTFDGCVNVAPGANKAVEVRALIAAGQKRLCFGAGTYTFEAPVFTGLTPAQVSGVELVGAGSTRTTFKVSYSPGAGLVDDPTQALLYFRGQTDAVVATTVAAGIAAVDGSTTFTVTAGAGIVNGMRFRIRAHNAPGLPTDALGMSDGANVILTELTSAVTGRVGAVVTLASPLLQWHTPGATVDSVQPVQNVLVSGIGFDFTGAGNSTVSNAIYSELTDGITVLDCSFRSMTRTGCELGPGTRVQLVRGLVGKGLINGLCFGDSCMLFDWHDFYTMPDVERVHPLGVPRHFVFCQERCTGGLRTNMLLQHGSAGICDYGGWLIHTDGIELHDMDDSAIRARNPLYSPVAYVGLGVESGAGPLPNASFAYALTYDNIDMWNLYGGDFSWCWFWHDIICSSIGRATMANKGPVYGSVIDGITYKMQGMLTNDMQGRCTLDSLVCSGVTFGWFSYGGSPIEVGLYAYDGGSGNGGGSIAIWIDTSIPNGAPRFDRVRLTNVNGARLRFGTSFAAVPDWNFQIREYTIEEDRWEQARLIRNNDVGPVSWNVGDGVEIDPAAAAGELGMLTPGGTRIDAVVCVGAPLDVGTGLMMAALLPARIATVNASAAAVLRGDRLKGAGAGLRTFATVGAATNLTGTAITAKAAGAPGLVVLGPAPGAQ